jgi:hypothetical protein
LPGNARSSFSTSICEREAAAEPRWLSGHARYSFSSACPPRRRH